VTKAEQSVRGRNMSGRQHVTSQDEGTNQNQMEVTDAERIFGRGRDNDVRASKPTRLSVNISRSTVDALQEVASDNGITMTEAVRRLIGYGIIMYRANRDGYEVLLRRENKLEKIILVD
jgi:hypothetical protein